jgi:hypothetical protein
MPVTAKTAPLAAWNERAPTFVVPRVPLSVVWGNCPDPSLRILRFDFFAKATCEFSMAP